MNSHKDYRSNTNANAQYHLLKLLTALGVIDNFVLRDNTFVPLKTTWRYLDNQLD